MIDTNSFSILSKLVMSQAMTLEEKVVCLFHLKDNPELPSTLNINPIHNYNGFSGLNFWDEDVLIAQVYIGLLKSDTFVIYKKTFFDEKLVEVYDYYDLQGQFFYTSNSLDGTCIQYQSIQMESTSPYLNFLYNVLNIEYNQTVSSFGNTTKIKYIEKLLNIFYQDTHYNVDARKKISDPSILKINQEILKIEEDHYLGWRERQDIFKSLKARRASLIKTKRRVHSFNIFSYDLMIILNDQKIKTQIIKKRPLNNFIGLFHHHTIGRVLWFFRQIRENLGFSIAMAIYGPFTFYFITQPMNPHAMWAVGKVRGAYLDTVNSLFVDAPKTQLAIQQEIKDKVSTAQSGNEKVKKNYWNLRMDDFKAMQIKYESAMTFSERMGRIEQFESQFNFPLTAEAAWMEMEKYNQALNRIMKETSQLDHRLIEFIKKEQLRTSELQFYIWNKLGQFFLDFPYIVVDEENDQPYKSYYVGRQFIFFEKMAKKLTKLGMFDSPKTHKNIKHLAQLFSKNKVVGSSVLDTLKKNSKVFRQKNLFSSDEHRAYMKRQWEILFIQQNKKQEAASFALQSYTWSIKNALWLIQSIYSAKRSELAPLQEKYSLGNPNAHKITSDEEMNEYYGNMFHNLVMEYISVKKEMVSALPQDNEWKMREKVIGNIKDFLIERDKLFSNGSVATKDYQVKDI